ncbi:MAG: sigma-70 family RNA polymerase sigma factor [Chloroflexota bacterium]|nr:sigma-70 family RNA polymerase sigma factor [Chloroflexota bacterium]
MNEAELVERSKRGDVDAFNQLVEAYQQQVYNLCLRMVGNLHDAEDVTQAAFLLAFKGVGGFRGGSFRAWLFRIAANACRDHLRLLRRRPTSPLDELPVHLEWDRHATSPEEYAARRELQASIMQALAALPADQRLAVTLRDVMGLEYGEIAQATASSLGTVKSRINRGRTRLRQLLSDQLELSP